MLNPYWPLFDLEVRTPTLTLRYLDDALGVELATLAAQGIHDPSHMPFSVPWTDVVSPELERNALRFYWQTRAETGPTRWHIVLAALEGDVMVGSTSLLAVDFPITRTFETGSWVGRRFQGRGLGTEMRAATLHLGFLGLHADQATTRAFADNPASLGVTRKLGYAPNGIDRRARRGLAADTLGFTMGREWFLGRVRRDDIAIAGAEAACELLEITPA